METLPAATGLRWRSRPAKVQIDVGEEWFNDVFVITKFNPKADC